MCRHGRRHCCRHCRGWCRSRRLAHHQYTFQHALAQRRVEKRAFRNQPCIPHACRSATTERGYRFSPNVPAHTATSSRFTPGRMCSFRRSRQVSFLPHSFASASTADLPRCSSLRRTRLRESGSCVALRVCGGNNYGDIKNKDGDDSETNEKLRLKTSFPRCIPEFFHIVFPALNNFF
jgi:hypothetical protein